jgi:hypothetical protein
MKLKKNLLAATITSITALSLLGCGTDEKQDQSSNTESQRFSLSGLAVDGPIARALVYYDLNGNRKKDSFEPGALTDNNGHYNKFPVFEGNELVRVIDYCKGLEARPEFCLKLTKTQATEFSADTKLIVTGGYDLYTGEPFEGSLSTPANKSYASGIVAITPMSSMINNGGQGVSDLISYLISLPGITDTPWASTLTLENIFDLNFLESEAKFNAPAFAVTYRLHKYVSVIEDWIKEQPAYSEINDGENLNSDISGLIYQEYQSLNNATFSTAWSSISTKIDALYVEADLTPPTAPDAAPLMVFLADIKTATEKSFGITPYLGSELTFANVKGRTRGVEVVVLKVIRGAPHASAITALDDDAYKESLEGATSTTTDEDGNVEEKGSFNFTQLVEATGDSTAIIDAANAAKNSAGSSLSSDLAGKMLDFEDDGTDASIDSKAAIFFTGAEGATRGEIHLCLKYSDTNDSDAMLAGDYISGTWETLAALNNTVMLRLDYLGGRSAVLKKIGLTGNTDPGLAGETEYRFDFNGETAKFSSTEGFNDTGDTTVITSSAACKIYVES